MGVMTTITKFTLNGGHLLLARRMFVGWQDCETGAPEIDPKRPYGNSDVESDVCELLGWKSVKIDGENNYTDEQKERAMKIHKEMETALQIMLCCYPAKVGPYKLEDEYNSMTWRAA